MNDPQISVARNGRVLGKYSKKWIIEALRDGTLIPTDHAIADGMPEWKQLGEWGGFSRIAPLHPAPPGAGAQRRFRGPPHECWNCGGKLRKGRKASHTASGCLLILLGLFIAGVGCMTIIGILPGLLIGGATFLVGMHLANKAEAYWQCKKCDATFPRKIRFWEMG